MTSVHQPEDVRIFLKECTSLARAGYEVYLVERGESFEKNGVHVIGVGQPSGGRIRRMTSFAKKVYETALALDAQIYHFHDPELLPYGLKLKKKGKKVIFDSHELYTEQMKRKPYLPLWCTRLIARLYGVYETYVLRRIDGAITEALIDGVHPFEGCCRHVETVNNVPILAELYDRYDPSVEKYKKSICYVGSLSFERGITYLAKAAALAGCTAYIAGSFNSQDCERRLQSMPEYAAVRYLGKIGREEVAELIQHCEIGMATVLNIGEYNRFDNLLTKTYEYMSLGVPVILTRAPFNEQIISRYQFGLCVDAEDPEETAKAIRFLQSDPAAAARMGANGRRAVREQFNWDIEEKRLLAFYETIYKDD